MNFFDDIGGDQNADGVDERVGSGGGLPVGFYRAKLDGATNGESKTNSTPYYELTFLVTAGPFAGATITEKLYKQGKDAAATAKCRDRIKAFAHRLGLITKSQDGKTYLPVEGKETFGDVLDTECVIEVKHEPDREQPGKHWPRLEWGGVFTPNDPIATAALANGGRRPATPNPFGAGQEKGRRAAAPAGPKPNPAPAANGTPPTTNGTPPAAPTGRPRMGREAL